MGASGEQCPPVTAGDDGRVADAAELDCGRDVA